MDNGKELWNRVKGTWDKAHSFVKSIASKGVFTTYRADPETKRLRVLSCHGDGAGIGPCVARSLSSDGRYHYCNLCGCGEREMAALDGDAEYTKLDFPYLECPLKKPGFSNYEGDKK